MHSLFAGIHLQNKPNDFLPLENIDFERDVLYLKQEIAGKLQFDANQLEIVYNGTALDDEAKLGETIRPNATVHCFHKTERYTPYVPPSDITISTAITRVQELFNIIAHIQINVNSRVNILQKIVAEYPEFRRNLGAQALIRDSVLFNTLHQPEVIKNIAEHYPIICDAAPFIVDTIKKELTRSSTTSNISEPATDSTNSSEEENSLGASSSSERASGDASGNQSETARIRRISRQQLQTALAQIGFSSVNSLSNIAQRNSDTSTASGSAPLSNSASGERISSQLFRNQLQRALNSLSQRVGTEVGGSGSQQMDTTETPSDNSATLQDTSEDGSGDIPTFYRNHQYAEQLRTMAQMGFIDYEENLIFLNLANGNIESAINLLMGSMN